MATVPVPTRMVSQPARRRCTSARAGGPDTQREVPSAAADLPSRVAANFQVTKGRR